MRISAVFLIFILLLLTGFPQPQDGRNQAAAAEVFEPCGTWQVLGRPTGPGLHVEPAARPGDGPITRDSDHFRVHYGDAGLAEYADSILSAAEKSYGLLIGPLGYDVPPSDGVNGGDSRIDIYVQPYASFPHLGRTMPEDWKPGTYPNSYSSYMELVDTLSLDLLLTTTAHECFHVFHIGYDKDERVSYLEMIAVWFEDIAYDDINAYRRHLDSFFNQPWKTLFGHIYSNVVWAIYLTENFGNDILREILETGAAIAGDNTYDASVSVISGYGTTFNEQFNTFTLWNFFTGARDDGLHYQEGGDFPLVYLAKTIHCLPFMSYTVPSLSRPGRYGCNYHLVHGNAHTDTLRIDFIPEYYANSVLTSTRFIQGGTGTVSYNYPQFTSGVVSQWEPGWPEADSLLLVYNINTSAQSSNSFGFSLYLEPAAAPVPSYVLVLDRDGCEHPFDGSGDEFSPVIGQDYPYSAALAAQSIRFASSNFLPADLNGCDVIFVIGGHDGAAVNLQPAEMESLMTFMDRGGDVYLESNRIGDWLDPAQGSPTATEASFWGYFGCDYLPGDTMTAGNVSSWQTPANSSMGTFSFGYDGGDPPDNFVGELVPASAETLAVDQAGRVRAVFRAGPGESYRIHSTVMLGASTGNIPGSSRESYLYRVLELFQSTVPALSVTAAELTTAGGRVTVSGWLGGYDGQSITLIRSATVPGGGITRLPVDVQFIDQSGRFVVTDSPPAGFNYLYRLVAESAGAELELWRAEVTLASPPPAFELVYPNPSRGSFQLVIESAGQVQGRLRVYDAAGRQVYARSQVLRPGRNELFFEGRDNAGRRLASGIYFIQLNTPAASAVQKLIILR